MIPLTEFQSTEPQNGRGWKGPLKVILSSPLEKVAQNHIQTAFEDLQGQDRHWDLILVPFH